MPTVSAVEILVIGGVLGVLGYLASEQFRKNHGFCPWHLASGIWAVITFALGLIGFLIMFIAARTTKPADEPVTASGPGVLSYDPVPAAPGYGAPPGEPTTNPAGWFVDPTQRYANRYWDGVRWTEHVTRTDGTPGRDPL